MGRRTEFEIRRLEGGLFVYSRFKVWEDGGEVRDAGGGGLARSVPFRTIKAAKAWVAEQFSIPPTAWRKRVGAPHVAGKGDPLPRQPRRRQVKR